MYKVIYGNNITRNTEIVSGDMTPFEFIEKYAVDTGFGVTTLNGVRATTEQMNTPFSELGLGDKVYILQVMKAQDA